MATTTDRSRRVPLGALRPGDVILVKGKADRYLDHHPTGEHADGDPVYLVRTEQRSTKTTSTTVLRRPAPGSQHT